MLAQLVVYCGYRGFGSAQVHWGAYLPTYLPPIYVRCIQAPALQGGPTDLVIYGR